MLLSVSRTFMFLRGTSLVYPLHAYLHSSKVSCLLQSLLSSHINSSAVIFPSSRSPNIPLCVYGSRRCSASSSPISLNLFTALGWSIVIITPPKSNIMFFIFISKGFFSCIRLYVFLHLSESFPCPVHLSSVFFLFESLTLVKFLLTSA